MLWVTFNCLSGKSGKVVFSCAAAPFGGKIMEPKFTGKIPVTETPLTFVSIGMGMLDKSKLLPFDFGS